MDRLGRLLEQRHDELDGERPTVTAYTYDRRGRVATMRDGLVHRYTYDGGRVVREDHDGQGYAFAYDTDGRPSTMTDQRGFAWVHHYDGAGNLVMKEQRLPPPAVDSTPLVGVVYTYNCF